MKWHHYSMLKVKMTADWLAEVGLNNILIRVR